MKTISTKQVAIRLTEAYGVSDEAAIRMVMRAQVEDFFIRDGDDPSICTLARAHQDAEVIYKNRNELLTSFNFAIQSIQGDPWPDQLLVPVQENTGVSQRMERLAPVAELRGLARNLAAMTTRRAGHRLQATFKKASIILFAYRANCAYCVLAVNSISVALVPQSPP